MLVGAYFSARNNLEQNAMQAVELTLDAYKKRADLLTTRVCELEKALEDAKRCNGELDKLNKNLQRRIDELENKIARRGNSRRRAKGGEA